MSNPIVHSSISLVSSPAASAHSTTTAATTATTATASPAAAALSQSERAELMASLERVAPHAYALTAAQLRALNVDATEVTRLARSSLPYAAQAKALAKAQLPLLDWAPIDRIADVCSALTLAHEACTNQRSVPVVSVTDIEKKAIVLRADRAADLEPLVSRNLLSRAELDALRSGTGREDLLSDLRAIERSLARAAEVFGARFWVSADQFAELAETIRALDGALQAARSPESEESDWSELRTRLFSLLALDYEQLRRAATFLLWGQEGAVEKCVPSLFLRADRGRSGEKRKPEPQPQSRTDASDATPQHDIDPNGIVPQDDPFAQS